MFYPLKRSIAFSCNCSFRKKCSEDENTQHNTTIKTEQSSAGVTQQGQSTVDKVCMTDGLAHAGSQDAGLKLQGDSDVAFRIVEDADEPKM